MSEKMKLKLIKSNGEILKLETDFRAYDSCRHMKTIIDETLNNVVCGDCGKELNPMWVLKRLAYEESRFKKEREAYIEAKEELEKKQRTKCQHCGKMTRIRRS